MNDLLDNVRLAVAAGALHLCILLGACQSTTPADLAAMQAQVAAEMGITFYLPAPVLVGAYDLSADGRTLARTSCLPMLNVVQSIQYRDDVSWSRNKAIIAHELQHAIQCNSGKWRSMTSPERERESQAIEKWWTASH